jgi:hypothetical protein
MEIDSGGNEYSQIVILMTIPLLSKNVNGQHVNVLKHFACV